MPLFTAPDGKTFTSKPEYRDYMMENYFSVKNKKNEVDPIVKRPGEIDGQVFEIADCEKCTIVIMDLISQLNVDNIKDCKLFVGACSGSIFIRNCVNCIVYSCCQQLRLRDAVDSQFFTFSPSEVHIELSSGLRFGPFIAAYPEHATQVRHRFTENSLKHVTH